MKGFRSKMSIAAENLPIFMASHEGEMFDGKASFEEAACAFVPEVVKVKIIDLQGTAL